MRTELKRDERMLGKVNGGNTNETEGTKQERLKSEQCVSNAGQEG